jgi:predicted anti-sigma-YlaC factor YlaD
MEQTHNHQPFETWLLAQEPLAPDQARSLQAHLRDCQACRRLAVAWGELRQFLQHVTPLSPAPGFTARWQARLLAAEQEARRREQIRQSWGMLVASAGIAALLLALLIIQALVVFGSPERALLAGAYQISVLIETWSSIQAIFITLLRTAFSIVPPLIWFVIASGLGVLSLLWIVSLEQIIMPWRMKS